MKLHTSLLKGSFVLLVAFGIYQALNFGFHFSMARLLTVADDIFHVNMETHPLILDDVKTRRSMKKIKIPFLNAPMPAHKKYHGLRYRRSQVMDNETKTSDIEEDMRLPCCFNYTFA